MTIALALLLGLVCGAVHTLAIRVPVACVARAWRRGL